MKTTLVLFSLFAATVARGTTYLVGTDRDLIRSSTAIVVVTAGPSTSMRSPRGAIETSTVMHVEEAISGPLPAGGDVAIVELGGFVGGQGLAIAGAPRFTPGERDLLLLETDGDGAWTTTAMGLGRFTFARDAGGRALLVRDEGEIFGWDTDGTAHREQRRAAGPFLRFVRETAGGGNPPADYFVPRDRLIADAQSLPKQTDAAASTYLIQSSGRGIRWSSFPTAQVFFSVGSQPGATSGGLTAAQRGLAVWTNDAGSNIVYQYGGTHASSGVLTSSDGVNSIVFNDPTDYISGSFTGTNGDVLAIGGFWYGSATHTFNGETFFTIQEADLVVQDGINTGGGAAGLTGNGFDHVLAHELGHTLGFRHSDKNPDGLSPCTQPSCTTNALMNSSVNFNADPTGAALQAWDMEAAAAVYGTGGGGGGGNPCTPPSITQQPQSSDFHNVPVALSVTAGGTAPFTYQWYVGTRPDTHQPAANGTGPVLTIDTLTQTTSYWVRVTGQCTPAVDSDTATITVNGCPGVTIDSVSPSTTIIQGRTQTLTVSASGSGHPLTYQWYSGSIGDTTQPAGSGASITVAPAATKTYWVRVSNDCGASATSSLVTITVTPCTVPQTVIQPSDEDAIKGTGATLSATISGTQPLLFQWYRGQRLDTSQPVPNASTASFTTDPLSSNATFWLQATNACGVVSTNAVTVRVVSTCTPPVITVQPRTQSVASGTSALLTVTATGPSLTYAWYQGPLLDFTHPVGSSSPSLSTDPITTPTSFWVRITNRCGVVSSDTATVGTTKRRAVKR